MNLTNLFILLLLFGFCYAATNATECTTNDDCSSFEYCAMGECVIFPGLCGYIEGDIFTEYECCANTDCDENYFCNENHECQEVDYEQLEAYELINEVALLIDEAILEELDTSAAEGVLEGAISAYQEEDYIKAKHLAEQSLSLIPEPQAEEDQEEQEPPEVEEETISEEPVDNSWILLLAGTILIAAALVFVISILKGKRKGYKR